MQFRFNRSCLSPQYHILVRVQLALAAIGLMFCATLASAASIFDDEWKPPTPSVHQDAAPVTTRPAAQDAAPAATTPPLPTAPPRRAIPGRLEQARSRGLLKEAFAADIRDVTPSGRKKLAQLLTDEVSKSSENPVDQFVLLGGAIEAAKEAGSLRICFAAADEMAREFDVDALGIKVDAVSKVNLRGDSAAAVVENVQAALGLVGELSAAEDFTGAGKILSLARPLAAGNSALVASVAKLSHDLELLTAAHEKILQHIEKLKIAPDDPAANLAVGSYFCFSKGEWDRGLPLLAKGSDPDLKQLSSLELSKPSAADAINTLADGWWDAGAKQPEPLQRQTHLHAAKFYRVALDSATGLRRKVISLRIGETAAPPAAVATDAKDWFPAPGKWGRQWTTKGGNVNPGQRVQIYEVFDDGKRVKYASWNVAFVREKDGSLSIDGGHFFQVLTKTANGIIVREWKKRADFEGRGEPIYIGVFEPEPLPKRDGPSTPARP